ncbi:MAG: hypothetical protein E7342_02695 [Clostridiales bacterium]|nr:hypothetical protein [Clostridiales bacterium]
MNTNEKFLFVGVSPKPFRGKNYWYLDEQGVTKPNTYVWVEMGSHNRKQIVFVDSVKLCDKENLPFPIEKVRKIISQTTKEEAKKANENWEIF